MLFWNIFRNRQSLSHVEVTETRFKLHHITLVQAGREDEGGRQNIKCFNSLLPIEFFSIDIGLVVAEKLVVQINARRP